MKPHQPPRPPDPPPPILDVVGLGFGPANLALALCLKEHPDMVGGHPLRSLFLERKPSYDWHPNMLLDGASIQVSFLKDLVTLRNPKSQFSFLSYLQRRGRLLDFVNLRTFFPTRLEYNDYFCWVAAQLTDMVRYDREVTAVEPVFARGANAGRGDARPVELLRIHTRNLTTGEAEAHLSRHLVVATGGVPHIPEGIEVAATSRVFHSQSFLDQVRTHFPCARSPYRFVVVGSGQSAAEIFQYLYNRYPNAQVTAAMRRFAYKPADESEFVNEIFSPLMTDMVFQLPEAERQSLRDAHADTNYSAVDLELIRSIYRELYQMKLAGETRVRVRSMLHLEGIEQRGETHLAHFWNRATQRHESLEADGVILATGLRHAGRHPLLASLDPYLQTTAGGEYDVERCYRVRSLPSFAPGIYLQGFCESTHGLSDTLLSVLPIRSREILTSILAAQGEVCMLEAGPTVI
jgi:L-ornithine N5-oxygenase